MVVYFVTTNREKFKVARQLLSQLGIKIKQIKRSYPEIQAESLKEIVKFGLKKLSKTFQKEIMIEDSGLFINALNGFPGAYSSYIQKTIGPKGILRLIKNIPERRAEFRSLVGYLGLNGKVSMFEGVIKGKITTDVRGQRGSGYDFIFIPNGKTKTFAEMDFEEMIEFSDWKRSFTKFGQWYIERDK